MTAACATQQVLAFTQADSIADFRQQRKHNTQPPPKQRLSHLYKLGLSRDDRTLSIEY